MRDPAKTFEDLVWRKAPQFVFAAYRVSRAFPRSETFGVSSHVRRATAWFLPRISTTRCLELKTVLVEVSTLLEAYSHAILNSDSW